MSQQRILELLLAAAGAVFLTAGTHFIETKWVAGGAALAVAVLFVLRVVVREPQRDEWLRLAGWFGNLAKEDRLRGTWRPSDPDKDPVFALLHDGRWQVRGGKPQVMKDLVLACGTAGLLLSRSSQRLYRGLDVKSIKRQDDVQTWLNAVHKANETTWKADVMSFSQDIGTTLKEVNEIGELARACARMALRCYVLDE